MIQACRCGVLYRSDNSAGEQVAGQPVAFPVLVPRCCHAQLRRGDPGSTFFSRCSAYWLAVNVLTWCGCHRLVTTTNFHPVMTQRSFDGSGLGAGWRVLRRHLRNASGNPRKLWWIVRRALQIVFRGELRGVLQRHRVVEDFYRDYPAWVKVADRVAEDRIGRFM